MDLRHRSLSVRRPPSSRRRQVIANARRSRPNCEAPTPHRVPERVSSRRHPTVPFGSVSLPPTWRTLPARQSSRPERERLHDPTTSPTRRAPTSQVESTRYRQDLVARFTAVDDSQHREPDDVSGQVHGASARPRQAMMECCVYDPESCPLLTGSYMDYRAARDGPSHFTVGHTVSRHPQPARVKGCGEAGAIARRRPSLFADRFAGCSTSPCHRRREGLRAANHAA